MVVIIKSHHPDRLVVGACGNDISERVPCHTVDGAFMVLHALVYNIGGQGFMVLSDGYIKKNNIKALIKITEVFFYN